MTVRHTGQEVKPFWVLQNRLRDNTVPPFYIALCAHSCQCRKSIANGRHRRLASKFSYCGVTSKRPTDPDGHNNEFTYNWFIDRESTV